MKKLFTLALSVLMALSLAACQSSETSGFKGGTFEGSAKGVHIGKAAGFRYSPNFHYIFGKKQFCFFDPKLDDILLGRNIKTRLKQFSEIHLADLAFFRKLRICKGGNMIIVVDVIDCSVQLSPARLAGKLIENVVKNA